jgi:hypothetical protein
MKLSRIAFGSRPFDWLTLGLTGKSQQRMSHSVFSEEQKVGQQQQVFFRHSYPEWSVFGHLPVQ